MTKEEKLKATPEERKELVQVLNSKTPQQLMTEAQRFSFVSRKKDRKVGDVAWFYKRTRLDTMTRKELVDLHMEYHETIHDFNHEPEQKGHALQQQVDISNNEITKLTQKLNADKATFLKEQQQLKNEIAELEGQLQSNNRMSSVFTDVYDFTRIAQDGKLPTGPKKLTKKSIAQLKLFIEDEFTELEACQTKWETADWFVDHIYYMLNKAIGEGYNLEPVWNLVQQANMMKFPNGKVTKNEDGKVMKPKGWKSNDSKVQEYIEKCDDEGSWKK